MVSTLPASDLELRRQTTSSSFVAKHVFQPVGDQAELLDSHDRPNIYQNNFALRDLRGDCKAGGRL